MSTDFSLCFYILRITIQVLVFGYRDSHTVIVNSKFTPYVSEFEYASRFHPSKNPDCGSSWSGSPDEYEDGINRENFARYGRSPEEGPSVGQEPSIELRAILVRCPMTDGETDDIVTSREIFNITAGRSQDILDFHGFDKDEPTRHSEVRDCRRKLVITMRFNNIGRTKTQEEFVVIDHVLDPVTMHKARLLNPLVVKVRQEPVLQLYALKFQEVVNAEAKEEVINNKQSNFKGCDDTSENPTCGQMFMDDEPIPYSRGFCCSCDPEVNIQRQILALNDTVPQPGSSFFSRSKDRLIKPFKNIRSVEETLIDPSDSYESSLLSSPRDINNIPRIPENHFYQQNFNPLESDSTLVENSYKDEKDLLNLKNVKLTNGSLGRASRSGKIASGNRIEAGGSRRRGAPTLIQYSSGTINENPGNLPDARRDTEMNGKDEISESHRKHEENLPKRKSSINIIDELAKLEADYKNFRISSITGDEGKGDYKEEENRRNIERETFRDKNYLDRGLNADDVEKFRPIDSLEKELTSKNEQDNGNYASSSGSRESRRVEENVHHSESTKDIHSEVSQERIDRSRNPHATTLPISEAQTAAVFWQKLASDGVYSSSKKKNVNSKLIITNALRPSTEVKNFDENTVHQAANLHSDSIPDNSAESFSLDNTQPNNDRSILKGKFDRSIFQRFNTVENRFDMRMTPGLTAKDHRDWNDFTTSSDETFSRAENFTDSFSSFLDGNRTRNDAFASRGSLRNQLGNWLTYDERKRYESKGDSERLKKNYGEKIEFRNKGEFGEMSFATLLNATTKIHDHQEDTSSAPNPIERPVEIYSENRYDREFFQGINDALNIPKVGSNYENASHRASRNSKHLKYPRSHRSITKANRFSSNVNDQYGNVREKWIIRRNRKSKETSEYDSTAMKKFPPQVHDTIPSIIAKGNYSILYRNSIKTPKDFHRNDNNFTRISRKGKERFIDNEFPLKNTNDISQNRCYLHINPACDHVNGNVHNVKKNDVTAPVIEVTKNVRDDAKPVFETLQTTVYKVVIDRFTLANENKAMAEHQENFVEGANSSVKVHERMVSTATLVEASLLPKNESFLKSVTEVSATMTPRFSIDSIKKFDDFHDFSSNGKQRINPLVSYDREISKELATDSKKLLTNSPTLDSSFKVRSALLTIENLKKELKNEAEHYSPFFQSGSTAGESSLEKVERYWKNPGNVREINTVLTPAEKVEDLITDQETLPPDEETKLTTFHLSQTTNFSFSTRAFPFVESVNSNATVFSRLPVRNIQDTLPKKMNINSMMHEKFHPSFTEFLEPLKSESVQEKKLHRRRHRRKNTANKKQFSKYKRSSKENNVTTRAEDPFEKGGVQSSDDPQREINFLREIIGSNSKIETTTLPMHLIGFPIPRAYKKRKPNYGETQDASRGNLQNKHEISHSNQKRVELGNRRSIDDFYSNIEAPIKDFLAVHKNVENDVAHTNFNHDTETVDLPLKTIRKSIILEELSNSSLGSITTNTAESMRPGVITGILQRNFQTAKSQKFPSVYPRSSDIIAASRNSEAINNVANSDDETNKRDDIAEIDENGGGDLIFYDYNESEDDNSDNENIDDKRSLNDIAPEGIIDGIEPADGWKEKMELLKLKKHADVLKEYLNWRQDVAPLEPLQFTGYTTKIAMTNERPDETAIFIPTTTSIENRSAPISSAESTCSTSEETLFTPIERSSSTSDTSYQQDVGVEVTTNINTLESLASTAVTRDATRNFDKSITTNKVDVPTTCFLNSNDRDKTTIKVFSQNEDSIGRILPPCDSKVECPLNIDDHSNTPTTPNLSSDYSPETQPGLISDLRTPCSDVDNDLLIISILEKSQEESKKNRGVKGGRDPVAKIYKIRDEGKLTTANSLSHRRILRKKISRRKAERKLKLVPGRRLMAIQPVNEDYEKYNEDMDSEDSEKKMDIDSFGDASTRNLDVDEDDAMLKQKWNYIIGKIMRENYSESSLIENKTESGLKDFSDYNGSILTHLHFYDADKYIRKVAKQIVKDRNIYDIENKKNYQRENISRVKRKLLEHPDQSTFGFGYGIADANQDGADSINSQSPADNNTVSRITKESSQRKGGHDYAISLTGKIHVEGGTNGQPISISFDTSPHLTKINGTRSSTTNNTVELTNNTNGGGSASLNTNILSSIFNIAPAPKEIENTLRKNDESPNSIVSQPPRPVRDDESGEIKNQENRSGDSSNFIQTAAKIRKTRAVDPRSAKWNSKHHGDRSVDLEGFQNSNEDAEDYPESSLEYEYNNNYPLIYPNHKTLESERDFSVFDNRGKLNSPEVKVIKIVPLTIDKPTSAFSLLKQNQKIPEAKVSRMTASQLPKMKDDDVPGRTVLPGKIKPAELPLQDQERIIEAHSVCPFPKDEAKDLTDAPLDENIFTNNSIPTAGLVVNETDKGGGNSNRNFEQIPMFNIHIQQKPINKSDHNFIVLPGSPDEGDCPNIDVTRPSTVVDDSLKLCSQNNFSDQTVSTNIVTNPTVTTPCSETDKPDIQTSTSIPDYIQCETTRPTEKPSTHEHDRETLPATTTPHSFDKSEARNRIRMRNMLAILEFMKKINRIMSQEDETNFPSDDYNDAVIKLERVIIIPNNSDDIKSTTHSTVLVGVDSEHNSPCKESSVLPTSRPPLPKLISIIQNGGCKEDGFSDSSLFDNKRFIEKNEDQSFLFDEKNDKIMDQASIFGNNLKSNRFDSDFQSSRRATNFMKKEAIDSSTEPFVRTTHISQNSGGTSNNQVSGLRNETSASREGTNFGKKRRKMRYESVNKRKATRMSESSINQRHPSINHFPSIRDSYVFYDQSNVGGEIDRSKLSSDVSDRIDDETFGKVAVAENTFREKRKRKKKRKRKRKKTKKKKGKVRDREVATGKSWWPLKRQLMSFTEKHHFSLESNFGPTERPKMKKRTSYQRSSPLVERKIRKVHLHDQHQGNMKPSKTHPRHEKRKETNVVKIKTNSRKNAAASGRNKRQINPRGTQSRGGQDCMDRRHPPNTDPVKYLESAHCLRFSDLWQETWQQPNFISLHKNICTIRIAYENTVSAAESRYSVYELENPILEHTVYMQLFEKHSLADGTTHWDDLTRGTMVRMGTFIRHQRDDKPTIVFTYTGARMEAQNRALNLDPTRQRLLVPSPVPPNKASQYSAVRGPGEYLVVQANAISNDGKECDKAGVSIAAFAKQDDRCGRAKGSCLKNQPLAYWRHDMEARDSGRPGCYFLSNFATVPSDPIKYNISGTGSQEYLGLEYHSSHVSIIDIEVRTDYNAIVRVGSSGRVTEVYIDSTSLEHTVVTMVISNMGLASSSYQPRIADCPPGLPVSWSKAKGIMQIIPPQHDHRVTLDLYGQLLLNGFHCTVEVVNHRGELVAMRRIRVQKMDRCFCVWHCLCACIGSVSGLACQPMSLEHYHAAGFQGPVPLISTETSLLMDTFKNVLILSGLLLLLLLILGFLKWFVGLFSHPVGRWGLQSILDGSKIDSYLEPELRCRCVVTDDDGVPVHPDTGQRTVRLCSRKLEFVLNLIFFLIYPITICRCQFRKSSRQHRCYADDSKTCLLNEKSSGPKLICVSTYGDSRNSKLEAEDTRYVMSELKKSQESLQNPKRMKAGLSARKRDT